MMMTLYELQQKIEVAAYETSTNSNTNTVTQTLTRRWEGHHQGTPTYTSSIFFSQSSAMKHLIFSRRYKCAEGFGRR